MVCNPAATIESPEMLVTASGAFSSGSGTLRAVTVMSARMSASAGACARAVPEAASSIVAETRSAHFHRRLYPKFVIAHETRYIFSIRRS
ncbi:hypothetical protein GCM10019071_27280 [Sphingobium fuliginis]|uniref:Uncharacterized protein n=2 Tax=Sphingobium fuliginis (strain ATCC 27551) TaxID=336203 RepID=A0ABQ1F031_SPHSA|nr:hypothetical protein GCM10019071_27280 [Sphingobium fuliginis]